MCDFFIMGFPLKNATIQNDRTKFAIDLKLWGSYFLIEIHRLVKFQASCEVCTIFQFFNTRFLNRGTPV